MNLIPQRKSLVTQVVAILSRALARGRWRDCLPGQRSLCDSLQVSRTTLEQALNVLKRQGLIRIAHGRRTRIVARPRTKHRSGQSSTVIALIPKPLYARRQSQLFTSTQLQHHLQDAGFELEIHFDARLTKPQPSRHIEDFVCQHRAACWLLSSMGPAVQHWFAERGVPVLVGGTLHAGIHLPSLDLNHEAIGRHAAGRFLGAGHRRVALLMPRHNNASDLATERGFQEAFAAADEESTGQVVHYDGTVTGIRGALRSLFEPAASVTGLFVAYAEHVSSVIGHLLTSGIRLPRDVAVVSREFEEFLAYQVPSIACYRCNWQAYAYRLSHLVVELARTGYLPVRATRIMAEFHPGDSFGPIAPPAKLCM